MICFRHKYYVKDAEERRIIGVIRISILEYKISIFQHYCSFIKPFHAYKQTYSQKLNESFFDISSVKFHIDIL